MISYDLKKFEWINQAIQENDGAVTQRIDDLVARFLEFKRSNPAVSREVDNMYTQRLFRDDLGVSEEFNKVILEYQGLQKSKPL
mgnify:CR=1 FL=1